MDTIGQKLLYTLSAKNAISSVLTDANIEVPQAFGDYAATISAHIGTPAEEAHDVEFIDYDGTSLHKYTFEEAAALTAMPELPTRSGFTNEGWNYTLAELTAAVAQEKRVIVGCTYITDDDITKIYVTLPPDNLALSIAFAQTETSSVALDWGDGSAINVAGSKNQMARSHTYQQAGDYVVTLTPRKSYATLILGGNIGGNGAAANNQKITNVEIGKVYGLSSYIFSQCDNLSAVSFPKDAIIKDYACDGMTKLESFVLPNTLTSIPYYMFAYCSHLKKVSISPTITTMISSAFYGCADLMEMPLVNINTLAPYGFQRCSELKWVQAKDVTSIPNHCFYGCGALTALDTAPISEVMGNSFYGCEALESIGTTTLTSFGSGKEVFAYCDNLREVGTLQIPANSHNGNRPKIDANCFADCKSLHTLVVVPDDSLSSLYIGSGAFQQSGITTFDFTACTQVPELANVNAFSNTPSDKKILVPGGLMSAWKTKTNWSNNSIVNSIIGV